MNSSDEFGVSQDTSGTLMLKIADNLFSKLNVAESLDTFYASEICNCFQLPQLSKVTFTYLASSLYHLLKYNILGYQQISVGYMMHFVMLN